MPPLPDDPALSGLLDEIHLNALRPEGWAGLPERLAGIAGGGAWAIQLVRNGASRRAEVHGHGFDPALLSLYPERFAAENPWLPAMRQMPLMRLVRDDEILDRKCLMRSDFFADFLRPQGDIHRAFGIVISRNGAGSLVISCNYAPEAETGPGQAGLRLLARIAPQLRRSFELLPMAERAGLGGGMRVIATTGLSQVCFALDSRGRLVTCDARAEALLAQGDLAHVSSDRRLCLRDAQAAATLEAGLARDNWTGAFAIHGAGAHPMLARLAPLPRPELIAPLEVLFRAGRAVALLIVAAPGAPGALDEDLGRLFDLTPVETLVLRKLCDGLTPAEIALMRGVSGNTVRNQLRSLFDKTGTRRQAELVALVARLGG